MISLKKLLYKIANIDYVVETGSTTVSSVTWEYKKWRSGICEAWRTDSGSGKLSTQSGNWRYGDVVTTGQVESGIFDTTATVTGIAGVYCTSTSSTGFIGSGNAIMDDKQFGGTFVVSGASVSTSYTYKVNWHLFGRWKAVETI